MPTTPVRPASAANLYAGWIAGGLVVLGVLLIGAFFWFSHHP
jgi:hypothetical protein